MSNSGVPLTDDLARDNPIPGLVNPLDLPYPGAGPVLAIKRFYQNYAKFSGRASRSEFWWVVLAITLTYGVLWGLGYALSTATGTISAGQLTLGPGGLPFFLVLLALEFGNLVPFIAVAVRRLHDANYSGLRMFCYFLPFVGGLALIAFLASGSKSAGRRFDSFRAVYAGGPQSGLMAIDDLYSQSQYPMQQRSPFYSAGPPA